MGTQNYTIHRYESAFPKPEDFQPERWLIKEGDAARHQAFTPFSVGPRKCVGTKRGTFSSCCLQSEIVLLTIFLHRSLAEMELSILTAGFFRRFDGYVDSTMREADMRMYDTFNAGPAGAKLLVHLTESVE